MSGRTAHHFVRVAHKHLGCIEGLQDALQGGQGLDVLLVRVALPVEKKLDAHVVLHHKVNSVNDDTRMHHRSAISQLRVRKSCLRGAFVLLE